MIWLYVVGILVILFGFTAFFGAPYVPTRRKDMRALFDELYPLGADDVVLDVGSGDGVVLREVSSRGAKAVGYEMHPIFVALSRWLSRGDRRVKVVWVNAWTTPFPDDVSLVYIFSVGRDGQRVRKKVQAESNRLDRPVMLACYGNPLPKMTPVRSLDAYGLYRFTPLHPPKP